MNLQSTRPFPIDRTNNILIRGTNWIGDVIMTLPAVASIRKTMPEATITVLAKPWVADIYRLSPHVDEVITFQRPGRHDGLGGLLKLAAELKEKKFDGTILLQNAIQAAIITLTARIPVRAGYNSDGRGLLLTHAVQRTGAIRKVHQIDYYLEMLKALGFQSAGHDVTLPVRKDDRARAEEILFGYGVEKGETVIGMAPGAAYGPAKMWLPDRFAALADRLIDRHNAPVLLFGSAGDRAQTDRIEGQAKGKLINLAGATDLMGAVALIARCNLFISNDSGLMHLAGALGVPLVAIFGSTNPATTSPVGEKSVIVHKNVSCSPCLKKTCPTDFRCMKLIEVDDVYEEAKRLLQD